MVSDLIKTKVVMKIFGALNKSKKTFNKHFDFHCTLASVLLKKNSYYIYNTADWHYGWDYELRRNYYKKIIGEGNVLLIDLNSWYMKVIFILSISKFTSKIDLTDNELSAFKFSQWDQDFTKISSLGDSLAGYKHNFNNWERGYKPPKYAECVKGIMHSDRFLGLVFTQPSYDDWPWVIMALTANKPAIEPEGPFGFTVRKSLNLHGMRHAFKVQTALPRYSELKHAIRSLKNRLVGKYSNTSVGYYIQDNIRLTPDLIYRNFNGEGNNIFFFLPCFSDSANHSIYRFQSSYIDYYELTLSVLDFFKNSNLQVNIKFHPNGKYYPFDEVCNKSIREIYKDNDSINFLDNTFTVNDLKFVNDPVVLSARGSVIAECAYMGIPNFSFYESIYTELNMSIFISDISKLDSTLRENKNLFKYYEAKLNAVKYEYFINRVSNKRVFKLNNWNKESEFNIMKSLMVEI